MIKHKIRDSKGNTIEVELSRGKAIKLFCYECMCWVKAEVRNCASPLCPLYPFRPLKRKDEKPLKVALIRARFNDLNRGHRRECGR